MKNSISSSSKTTWPNYQVLRSVFGGKVISFVRLRYGCFELLVNGKIVARGGAEDLSVLSHTVTARGVLGSASLGTGNVKDRAFLEASLTGLTSRAAEPSNVHRLWHQTRNLQVGDEITVRILESEEADTPETLARTEA